MERFRIRRPCMKSWRSFLFFVCLNLAISVDGWAIAGVFSKAFISWKTLQLSDFEARCDGRADDTVAIFAAEHARARRNGVLVFPVGTCNVLRPLVIASDAKWRGAGMGLSTIRAAAPMSAVADISRRVSLESLTFDANKLADTVINFSADSDGSTFINLGLARARHTTIQTLGAR
jgi:Pectate lyase superfamily protein